MADDTEQQIRDLTAKVDRLWDHLDDELNKIKSLIQNR